MTLMVYALLIMGALNPKPTLAFLLPNSRTGVLLVEQIPDMFTV